MIEAKADLRSFEAARASVTGLAQSAPAADAITDSLTMPQSDRAYFGIGAGSVQAFDLKSGALEQNLPNFNATSAEIFVVVLEKASGVQIAISSGTTSQNVAVAVGIHKVDAWLGVHRQRHQRENQNAFQQRPGLRALWRRPGATQWLTARSGAAQEMALSNVQTVSGLWGSQRGWNGVQRPHAVPGRRYGRIHVRRAHYQPEDWVPSQLPAVSR